jgi:hypothetical protein
MAGPLAAPPGAAGMSSGAASASVRRPLLPFAARPLLARGPGAGHLGGGGGRAAACRAAGRRRYTTASAAQAAWCARPPATLAGAAEAAFAGWGGLMSWASEGMWAAQSAILNAVNLAGSHLPKAIALLLADWINSSPLVLGVRGDSSVPWESIAAGADGGGGGGGGGSYQFGPGGCGPAAAAAAPQPLWRRAVAVAAAASSAAWAMGTTAVRLAWLSVLFAPVVVTAPFALQWGWRRGQWMELLRATLEAAGVSKGLGSLQGGMAGERQRPCHQHIAGSPVSPLTVFTPTHARARQPAWIKWGQWTATRHDLFPPDMCSALEQLHASAPAHRFKHTYAAITRAFGLPAGELFEWLEETPLASGSIGQVGGPLVGGLSCWKADGRLF